MGKPANGKVPTDALVVIETGHYEDRPYTSYAETATAAAYKRARTANPNMYLAPPLGAYRSIQDQTNLKNDPGAYGSSLPKSKIAAPGNSTHGWGTCVDVGPENAWFEAHCGEYGFVRESPAGENNHYRFTSPTWAPAPVAPVLPDGVSDVEYVKTIATYLNGRNLGKSSGASSTGLRVSGGSTSSNYWWEMQTAGAADGLYPQPAYKINGIPGPKTESLEPIYYEKALAAIVPAPPSPPATEPISEPPATPVPVPVETAPVPPVVTSPPTSTAPVNLPTLGNTTTVPTPKPSPVVTPPKTTVVNEVNKWLHGGVVAGLIAAGVTIISLCFGH